MYTYTYIKWPLIYIDTKGLKSYIIPRHKLGYNFSVQHRQEIGGDICLTTLEKKETFAL